MANNAALRRLELTVSQRIDGILQGEYRGALPGLGSESGDARLYAPGDDIRRMDWAATARTTQAHVRELIADHELAVLLVVEGSPTINFGTQATSKREVLYGTASAMSFLVTRGANRLGAVLASPSGIELVKAHSGPQRARALLTKIAALGDEPGHTDLTTALTKAARAEHRRALVIVISDFLGPVEWARSMAELTSRNDVIVFEIRDPRDDVLVDIGHVTLTDVRTGAQVSLDTSRPDVREKINRATRRHRQAVGKALADAHAEHVILQTDADWITDLVSYMRERQMRAASGRPMRASRSMTARRQALADIDTGGVST